MGKYTMPLYLAAGICNGVSSSINLNRYISEEDIQGREILIGASQYIKECQEPPTKVSGVFGS